MLVDDNYFNLMLLKILIRHLFQIKIEEACNGFYAFRFFKENYYKPCKYENRAFKLVLMDLNMPIMDGF